MRPSWLANAVAVFWFAAGVSACAGHVYDPPIACSACDAWNEPHRPFQIADNTWYVGTAGLSAILIDSGAGLVLIDGALPQSAALINTNIRALGFRAEDIAFILVSHVHYDHVGGIAALQRISGATVLSSPPGRDALVTGALQPDDPQFDPAAVETRFPPVSNVRAVGDGERVAIGNVALTGHHTPGHTPGGMTWSWRDCGDAGCRDVVYADSLSPISVDGYRYSADGGRVAKQMRNSAARIGSLPCDVFLSNHPIFFGMARKLDSDAAEPFVEPGECRAYAERGVKRLERRLREEAGQ